MVPFVRGEGQIGMWSCGVCGKMCCEQLYMFRAYVRQEFVTEPGVRRLDSFIAYISWKCGRGMLGVLTETARFKEDVFRLTSAGTSVDVVREQLEQALQRGGREDRLNLTEELERLTGIGPGSSRKSLEMTAVERLSYICNAKSCFGSAVAATHSALYPSGSGAWLSHCCSSWPDHGVRHAVCARNMYEHRSDVE